MREGVRKDGAAKNILIGGIGSVLLGDDAVGPYVAQLLAARYEFEEGVEVSDLGTPALDLIEQISGKDAVILIDCVDTQADPGTLILYRKEDIVRHSPGVRMDPHSPALVETLLSADFLGVAPAEVLLVGIVPKSFEAGADLNSAVRASVERAISLILSELDRLGIIYRRREMPIELDIWWMSKHQLSPSLQTEDAKSHEIMGS
jgi:hydrogenase maturation protease